MSIVFTNMLVNKFRNVFSIIDTFLRINLTTKLIHIFCLIFGIFFLKKSFQSKKYQDLFILLGGFLILTFVILTLVLIRNFILL
jgi:hypothetical protein